MHGLFLQGTVTTQMISMVGALHSYYCKFDSLHLCQVLVRWLLKLLQKLEGLHVLLLVGLYNVYVLIHNTFKIKIRQSCC